MISIHDLSKLSGVSTRMLRYYDKQEVLKPVEYAADGRRYYADDALSHLQQIIAFQSLGYSIHQIKELFSQTHSLQDLLDKQIDLLKKEQRRIDLVLDMLSQVKQQTPTEDADLNQMTKLIEMTSADKRLLTSYQDKNLRAIRSEFNSLDGSTSSSWCQKLYDHMTIPENATMAELDAESVYIWKANEYRLPQGHLDLFYLPGTELEKQDLAADNFTYDWHTYTDIAEIPQNQYDIIMDNYTYVHGNNMETWLDGMVKCLKPGGRFYCVVKDTLHNQQLFELANLLDPSSKSEYKRHSQVFPLEIARPMLEKRFSTVNIYSFCGVKKITDVDAIMKRLDSLVLYREKNDAAARQHQKVYEEIQRRIKKDGSFQINSHHFLIEAIKE